MEFQTLIEKTKNCAQVQSRHQRYQRADPGACEGCSGGTFMEKLQRQDATTVFYPKI